MYAEFYGFRELPFSITPDPRFLFLNECYQEALAALTYGVEARKGFVSLVGEAGTGKTTLLRRVLDTVDARVRTVLLLNPSVGFDEILDHILIELGVPTEGGGKLVRLQRLNEFLIEHTRAGGNVALLIDEAQDLRPEVLEELRLLSNLETAREKILQIILAGQPELDVMLADPRLRQLRQRVTLRVRLRPLTAAEVTDYVRTRLERAGAARLDVFTPPALVRVAVLSEGVPRLVNVLCDAALLMAFAGGRATVTPELVDEAWRDYATEARGLQPVAALLPSEPEPPPAVVAAPAAAAVEPEAEAPPAPLAAPDDVTEAGDDVPPTPRQTLSVPSAAMLVVAIAGLLYLLARPEERATTAPADAARSALASAPATPPPTQDSIATPAPTDAVAALPPAVEMAGERIAPHEAARTIEEFQAAFEARDVPRLTALFADDAIENGRQGRAAITAAYERSLPTLVEVRYTLEALAIGPAASGAAVQAPFVIRYTGPGGERRAVRGEAEWKLARRDGRTLIVALDYRLVE